MKLIPRTFSYIRRNGPEAAFYAMLDHLTELREDRKYVKERIKEMAGREQLASQSGFRFDNMYFISIIVPVFNPEKKSFIKMVESVLDQSYGNFELIMADGGTDNIPYISEICGRDERIRYRKIRAGGISENTNAGLAMASGDYAAFLDQDDFLEPDALFEVVRALQDGYDIVYTDEDKFEDETGTFCTPNRKPDFNFDLLLSNNYICHLFTVRRCIAEKTGGFRKEFDGAQDYDFILRCTEEAGNDKVCHIPRILYHWRIHIGSTAGDPSSKMYAYDNGKKVLEAYLARHGFAGIVKDTEHLGFYRIEYSGNADRDSYMLLIDGSLKPLCSDYERILSSYFVRPDIGVAGARIIGRGKRIICNGYRRSSDGRIESDSAGMDTGRSGYMHRAGMVQDTQAVSNHACLIRSELSDCIEEDSYKMCRKIRERGYTVIIDPAVVFRKE